MKEALQLTRTTTAPALDEELLRLLTAQVTHSPITVFVSMGIIAYMAYQQAPQLWWLWLGWLCLVMAAQLFRVLIIRRAAGQSHVDPRRMLRAAVLVNVCNTLLHSVSLVFFPLFTPFQAALQSMLFIGMGVASIVTAMGFLPFALAHVCLGLLPLFALWTWSGLMGPAGVMGLLIAVVGAAYMFALLLISRRIFAVFEESIINRRRLETALAEAEAAGKAKTRFLAAASHDLRQPIHTLSLFTAALGMRSLDPQARHIADNIEEAVKALTYQLDALLDMSKLDAGIVPVKRSRFALESLLRRLNEEFKAPAAEKSIDVTVHCPQGAVVNTDSALLERIVRNLLSNAIAHNSECQIQVVVDRQDRCWQLTVADTGAGIAESEQDKIFEEFYQVQNPERDRSKGLGLGLAIVHRLARLLDLELEMESAPGWGTRFTLQIRADTLPEADTSTPATASLGDLIVLVVDDETAVREGMRVLLEILGCRVNATGGTEEAVASAGEQKPDIVLADFRLREHDTGLNTISRLRSLYPNLPAIIVSGDTAPDRLLEAREAGVPVLSKPVLVDDLKAAISAVCTNCTEPGLSGRAPVA
jgi:signal transduction histidine kinase/ActR/RegA family two-component response regulator